MTATLLHIAEIAHWEKSRDTGESYEMSTLGRTLAEEGFIHCSSSESQAAGVLSRFYAHVDPATLVLLEIDPTKLDSPVRYEQADADVFPHVYGPIPPTAVIDVRPVPETR